MSGRDSPAVGHAAAPSRPELALRRIAADKFGDLLDELPHRGDLAAQHVRLSDPSLVAARARRALSFARPMRWLSRRAHRKARSIQAVGSLQVGDPRFDDWEVVRDFEDLKTALAWRQHLSDASIEAVITSDWPLDRFERGDIALRVPPGSWSEAEELLGQLDEEDW